MVPDLHMRDRPNASTHVDTTNMKLLSSVKLPVGEDHISEAPNSLPVLEFCLRRRFRDSPYAALHRVQCDCQNGAVMLRGRVASFFLKQLAQELVRNAAGVKSVTNRIDVVALATHSHCRQPRDF